MRCMIYVKVGSKDSEDVMIVVFKDAPTKESVPQGHENLLLV